MTNQIKNLVKKSLPAKGSCRINNSSDDEFLLFADRYIAGTITPEESTRCSPYLIRFENDSVAHFINTTASFPGKYTFQGDTFFSRQTISKK